MDSKLIANFLITFHYYFTWFTAAEPTRLTFTKEPIDTIAFNNERVILNCSINLQNFSHVEYRWRRNDTFLDVNRSNSRFTILSNGSLVIARILDSKDKSPSQYQSDGDQAFYQCYVTADNKWTFVSRKARLISATSFGFDEQPENRTVFEGEIVQFSCRITSKSVPKIVWYKDNRPIDTKANRNISVTPVTGSLQIRWVRLKDQGFYKCRVEDSDHHFSREGRLIVRENDVNVDASEPRLVVLPKGRLVKVGEDFVLECAASGQPEPKISWLKDRKGIVLSERISKVGQGSLIVRRVQIDDSGLYTCRASTSDSSDTVDASATVIVASPPTFSVHPHDLHAKETQDVEFECKASGKPTPTITWLKNGEVIVPSDYFVIVNQTKLKIYGLVKLDEAVYQCLAENEAGSAQTGARLFVQSIELTDLQSQNTVPSAPSNLRLVKVNGRSAVIAWDPPSFSPHSILGYTVYYKRYGSNRDRLVNATAFMTNGFILNGLSPDATYAIKVASFNKNGLGAPTPLLKVNTAADTDPPQTIRNLKVNILSPSSVELRWDPPLTADLITFYKLLYQPVPSENQIENSWQEQHHDDSHETLSEDDDYTDTDEDDETEIQVNGLGYTLHGLRADTNYRFRVGAVNRQSDVSISEPVIIRTFSDTPSAPPRNVSVSTLTTDSAVVRWSPPPERHRNGKLLFYRVRYRQKVRGSPTKYANVTANETQKLIAGLQSGLTYHFAVAATTINGTGPYSEWISFQLNFNDKDDYQVLGPVTALKLDGKGTEIHLAWSPPLSDGTVRGYKISWGPGIPDVHHELVDGAHRYHVIKDLRPNKEYVVCIRAYNKVDGFPVYETVRTNPVSSRGGSSGSGGAGAGPAHRQLKPPVGVRALTRSATSILVTWLDQDFLVSNGHPGQHGDFAAPMSPIIRDGRYYNVSVSSAALGSRTRYVRIRHASQHIFDQLRPNTRYEFSVQVVLDGYRSEWSMAAGNQTFSSAPTSSPTDLTIIQLPDNPTSVIINWMPPKHANGVITKYLVYYTTDASLPEAKWLIEGIRGDRMTTTIDNVYPDTDYTFKIQAINDKGYSPISLPRTFRTAPNGVPDYKWSQIVGRRGSGADVIAGGGGNFPVDRPSSRGESPPSPAGFWLSTTFTLIVAGCSAVLCCVVLPLIACVALRYRRRRRRGAGRRSSSAPNAGLLGAGGGKDLKPPPDLWIDHRIRNVNNVDADDVTASLDRNDVVVVDDDDKSSVFRRAIGSLDGDASSKMASARSPSPAASSDNQQPRYHSLTAMPPANCGTLPRNYRHNMLSGSASNNIDNAALLPAPHSARYQSTVPQVVYTGPKNVSHRDDCSSPLGSSSAIMYGNASSASQQHSMVDPVYTNSQSSNRHSNPLKSFTVLTNPPPAPPCIPLTSMSSVPTAKIHSSRSNTAAGNSAGNGPMCLDNRSPAPKLGSASVVMAKNKQQQKPLLCNTKLYSPAKSAAYGSDKDLEADDLHPLERSCSTEELSAQMRNLDNLMKDLNEISANEFDA